MHRGVVHVIDVDDAVFRQAGIEGAVAQEPVEDGDRERGTVREGGIDLGERNFQRMGERSCDVEPTTACRPEKQNHILPPPPIIRMTIMIKHCRDEQVAGIAGQSADAIERRNRHAHRRSSRLTTSSATASPLLLVHDRLAQLDAFATDVDVAGTLDERAYGAIILATERAIGVTCRHV